MDELEQKIKQVESDIYFDKAMLADQYQGLKSYMTPEIVTTAVLGCFLLGCLLGSRGRFIVIIPAFVKYFYQSVPGCRRLLHF